MTRRSGPKRESTYASRLAALRPYIQTSIRARTNFTRAEKSAITRQWNKLSGSIANVKSGKASFIKATPRQQANLGQKTAPGSKGFFTFGEAKARITGTGKNTKITYFYAGGRRDKVYPEARGFRSVAEMKERAEQIARENPGAEIGIRVSGRNGRFAYSLPQLLAYLDGEASDDSDDDLGGFLDYIDGFIAVERGG